ncbi:MAG: phosphoribosylglycinamide formyltransferase [Synergistaceae bacterium]|nr:phosphoribosylglycinamide formyltransferase [Synergistaceae bacterium]
MLDARISVLVSGGGTNLQALLDAQANGILKSGRVVQAISSRGDAQALVRARKAGVRADVVEFRNFSNSAAFERRLWKLLEEVKPDVVVLAGFMHILSAGFVARYEGRMVNVHPSLIPSFCGPGLYGLKVHEAVLAAGVKVTGATVHLVDAVPDGGPILMQRAVDVLPGDDPQTLQRRVMERAEWIILPQAVEDLCRTIAPGFGLRGNAYPGRGIILGHAPDMRAVVAYFIMGRSPSSRARVFERSGDGIVIRLLDAARDLSDPSLILYAPLRVLKDAIIVSNGDQTDTIRDGMARGGTFEDALRGRTFEPDAPHHTPRISGLLPMVAGKNGTSCPSGDTSASCASLSSERPYRLSILKAGPGGSCLRHFFEHEPRPGTGHLIHTYEGDGDPLPSFKGEPRPVEIPASIDAFTDALWDELDADNRVALYVRWAAPDGTWEDRIIDRHGEEETT